MDTPRSRVLPCATAHLGRSEAAWPPTQASPAALDATSSLTPVPCGATGGPSDPPDLGIQACLILTQPWLIKSGSVLLQCLTHLIALGDVDLQAAHSRLEDLLVGGAVDLDFRDLIPLGLQALLDLRHGAKLILC